jgi:hypothetical protein
MFSLKIMVSAGTVCMFHMGGNVDEVGAHMDMHTHMLVHTYSHKHTHAHTHTSHTHVLT